MLNRRKLTDLAKCVSEVRVFDGEGNAEQIGCVLQGRAIRITRSGFQYEVVSPRYGGGCRVAGISTLGKV